MPIALSFDTDIVYRLLIVRAFLADSLRETLSLFCTIIFQNLYGSSQFYGLHFKLIFLL